MSVSVTRLDSGLTVISHNMPHVETVALGVWAGAGSRDEAAAENGLAHLLEHMAFKGTPTRSAFDIAAEIEAAGGDMNASTSMEKTAYYARVLRDDWQLALDVMSDIVMRPLFQPDDLSLEKGVILQEIAAAQDTPDDLVFDLVAGAGLAGSSAGPRYSRHARYGEVVQRRPPARLSTAPLHRRTHGGGRCRSYRTFRPG